MRLWAVFLIPELTWRCILLESFGLGTLPQKDSNPGRPLPNKLDSLSP
jgi:hypothetical protein